MYAWRSIYWSEQVSMRTRALLMFDWVVRFEAIVLLALHSVLSDYYSTISYIEAYGGETSHDYKHGPREPVYMINAVCLRNSLGDHWDPSVTNLPPMFVYTTR
jgi:hypothetical protein